MDVNVYINGVPDSSLRVVELRRSYVQPWSARLAYDGRHDASGGAVAQPWDWVEVRETATLAPLFRGNIVRVSPGGVGGEGISIEAQDRRFRLENEPVRINGSFSFVWNRRGYSCSGGLAGEDSPGADGQKWTCGEIVIDILEHALGLPAAGSDIPSHHGDSCCITDTYLTSLDIAGYVAADWLALDSVTGEFSVSDTPVAQAIDMLVQANGGFYGWYLDEHGILRLADMTALPAVDLAAGELGHWQDEAGKGYELLDNRVDWTLDGVYSRVVVQGTDGTVEVKPANIEGCANAALGGGGELALIDSPWRSYPCAYMPLGQPCRHWTARNVGFSGSCIDWRATCECGVPANVGGIGSGPRIYRGTDAGDKEFVIPIVTPTGFCEPWRVALNRGIVMFAWDIEGDLAPDEKLWGWYWASVPFTSEAGPEGTAYGCFGFERTLSVVDRAFKHPTSWPQSGDAEDEAEMAVLAGRLLDQVKDVRMQGSLAVDGIDPWERGLERRFNVSGLTSATGGACSPHPMDWAGVALSCVEAVYDFESNSTELTVANSFWMLEGYSAMKERMKLNAWAGREQDLSESVYDCQVKDPDHSPPEETTTEWPTTTTTTGAPETTTTGAPGTTTTVAPVTTTTAWCDDCRDLETLCFRARFYGENAGANYEGCLAPVLAHSLSTELELGWECIWSEELQCGLGTTTTTQPPIPGAAPGVVDLVYYPTVGWVLVHEDKMWVKNIGALDTCDPTGTYTAQGGGGWAEVVQWPCGTTTEAPTTTTLAPPTTTTTVDLGPAGCPDAAHCNANCSAAPYFAVLTTGLCNSYDCGGTYRYQHGSGCNWSADQGPCSSFGGSTITCASGDWSLEVARISQTCIWRKAATTLSCPNGLYSIWFSSCSACAATITVYT